MNKNYFVDHKKTEWIKGKIEGFSGKDLLSINNGGVKLVRVSPESSYPVHTHPDKTEFMYLLEGKLNCFVDNEEFDCNSGDFIVFPEGMEHGIRNLTNEEALAIIGNIKTIDR